MVQALTYVDVVKPAKAKPRQKPRRYAVPAPRETAKQRQLVERLKAKADQADDPANWISLAGMTDEEVIAALTRD
jgi:hypothetical protein